MAVQQNNTNETGENIINASICYQESHTYGWIQRDPRNQNWTWVGVDKAVLIP